MKYNVSRGEMQALLSAVAFSEYRRVPVGDIVLTDPVVDAEFKSILLKIEKFRNGATLVYGAF